MWSFFKKCGDVRDIILSGKRDRNNKKFGFIKIISESKAGIIIVNANEICGIGARLDFSIN